MNQDDWSEYSEWHRLFDGLCNRAGFHDNATLASEFCNRTGRKGQGDFDAAKRKLGGWRSGRRLPRRGNLAVLSAILSVDRDPALERCWAALYRSAADAGRWVRPSDPVRAPAMPSRWIAAGVSAAAIASIAAAVGSTGSAPALGHLPSVGYDAYVRVALGTSRMIHGEYDSCEGAPPSWEKVAIRVPSTPLGTFEDGGVARKMVNDCGKEMAVRGVIFTGLSVGTEELYVLDDYMKIEVFESAPGPWEGTER